MLQEKERCSIKQEKQLRAIVKSFPYTLMFISTSDGRAIRRLSGSYCTILTTDLQVQHHNRLLFKEKIVGEKEIRFPWYLISNLLLHKRPDWSELSRTKQN